MPWALCCTSKQLGLRSDGLKVSGKGLMRKQSGKYREIAKASLFTYSVPVQLTEEKGGLCLLNIFLCLINSIHLRIEQLPPEWLLLLAWNSVRVCP